MHACTADPTVGPIKDLNTVVLGAFIQTPYRDKNTPLICWYVLSGIAFAGHTCICTQRELLFIHVHMHYRIIKYLTDLGTKVQIPFNNIPF